MSEYTRASFQFIDQVARAAQEGQLRHIDPFGRPREDDLGRAIEYTVHHVRASVIVHAEDGGPTEVTFRRPGGDHQVIVPSDNRVHREEWQERNQAHFPGEQLRVNREVLGTPAVDAMIVAKRRHHLEHKHTCLRWSLAADQFNALMQDPDAWRQLGRETLAHARDRQLLGLPLEVRRPGDLDGVSWLEWSVV